MYTYRPKNNGFRLDFLSKTSILRSLGLHLSALGEHFEAPGAPLDHFGSPNPKKSDFGAPKLRNSSPFWAPFWHLLGIKI